MQKYLYSLIFLFFLVSNDVFPDEKTEELREFCITNLFIARNRVYLHETNNTPTTPEIIYEVGYWNGVCDTYVKIFNEIDK